MTIFVITFIFTATYFKIAQWSKEQVIFLCGLLFFICVLFFFNHINLIFLPFLTIAVSQIHAQNILSEWMIELAVELLKF